jgi:hypothetical protein
VLENFGQILDNAGGQGWRTLHRALTTLDMVGDFWSGLGQGWRPCDRIGDLWTGLEQRWTGLESFGRLCTWLGNTEEVWRPLERASTTLIRVGDLWAESGTTLGWDGYLWTYSG